MDEQTLGDPLHEVGVRLRRAREDRGLALDACAAELRARVEQLADLEDGRLDGFGGQVYARGFLRSYAVLLGLDPAPLLAEAGPVPGGTTAAQLRTLPSEQVAPGRRTPVWAVGLVVLVAAGGLLTVVLALGGARTPPVAAGPPELPPVAAAPVAPAPAPAPTPPPVPAPPPAPVAPVVLVLTFEAASWLEVVADAAAVEPGRLVRAGETLRIEAEAVVVVRYGNAGGVRAELNGEDLGPQGRSGQVLRLAYGPEGVIAPTEAAPRG
jgi:cytoskeleton protein RodZ